MELNDTLKARLLELLAATRVEECGKPALDQVVFHHEGANLIGHVLLDLLEEQGFLPEDIDVMAGGDTLSLAIALSISYAAYSRGLDIDTWAISDGVLKGPKLNNPKAIIIKAETEDVDYLPLVAEIENVGGQVLATLCLWGDKAEKRMELSGLLHLTALGEADFSL